MTALPIPEGMEVSRSGWACERCAWASIGHTSIELALSNAVLHRERGECDRNVATLGPDGVRGAPSIGEMLP